MCRSSVIVSTVPIMVVSVLLLGWRCSSDSGPANSEHTMSLTGQTTTTEPFEQASAASAPAGWYERPTPPAARDYMDLRRNMVRDQLAHPRDDRTAVRDPRVLRAMMTVPRHVFAVESTPSAAYADTPLPIGQDQTISQPYVVGLMTELLRLSAGSRVLEIGTGSGYQAAVLAHLTPHVYTIEIVEPLARQAAQLLKAQGYDEIQCRAGDGYLGWPEAAPFDGIIVTCAAEKVPQPLWEQLKPGGKIVIPVGSANAIQHLLVITKTLDGQRRSQTITPVRFVPMTGKVGTE